MPAPVILGFESFIATQLNVTVWDGEVQRQDTSGNPISPEAPVVNPPLWPAIRCVMQKPGLVRTWTMADSYTEQGDLLIEMWGTARAQLETPIANQHSGSYSLLDQIEQLLAPATNWRLISLGGPSANIYRVTQALLKSWWCGQEDFVREGQSNLLYKGEMTYDLIIHGAVNTQ